MADQIPAFLLILYNEKCQQVEGQGSGVQQHARDAISLTAVQLCWLQKAESEKYNF